MTTDSPNNPDKKFFDQLILSAARESDFRKKSVEGTTGSAHNSMCGDVVEIGFTGDLHTDMHHAGEGCILSQAFAAIACKELVGKSKAHIKEVVGALNEYLSQGEASALPNILNGSGFAAASGLLEFSTRHPCILLFARSLEHAWREKWNESPADQTAPQPLTGKS